MVRERLCLAVLMLAMLTLASCREKPEEEANLVYLSGGDHRIRRRGEASVQITSDQKWSITSIDQLWVDASILEGVPGVTVTVKFTFEHNPTSSVRTANVTVVSGSTRGSITITQQAGFDPSSIDVSKIYIPWR